MVIYKCDECGKILTRQDDYFGIGEIDFYKGKAKNRPVIVRFPGMKKETLSNNENWCDYVNLHFCSPCFKKIGIRKYIK